MRSIPVLFICMLPAMLMAQRSEIGLFGGGSYYLGDLNPGKHFGNTRPAFGALYRYNLSSRWALKANAIYGTLIGDDASAVGSIPSRNLSFTSGILDVSAQIELNFLPYYTGSDKYKFAPYIFTGLSFFQFNPKAEYDGEWYDLQPLGTEGQGTGIFPGGDRYSLNQWAFPFGMGIKVSLGKISCFGVEWGMRKTFTDYLDDVSRTYPDPLQLAAASGPVAAALSNRSIQSPGEPPIKPGEQRGNPDNKDWYAFIGLTFTVKILTIKDHGCRDFQNVHRYDEYFYE